MKGDSSVQRVNLHLVEQELEGVLGKPQLFEKSQLTGLVGTNINDLRATLESNNYRELAVGNAVTIQATVHTALFLDDQEEVYRLIFCPYTEPPYYKLAKDNRPEVKQSVIENEGLELYVGHIDPHSIRESISGALA